MDCSQPGSSVHGISQARILEWVIVSFFRFLSDLGVNPCLLFDRWILCHWATWEAPFGLHIITIALIAFKAQSYLKIISFSFILSFVNSFDKILKHGHKRLISVLLVLRIANISGCKMGSIIFFFFLRISSVVLNYLWKLRVHFIIESIVRLQYYSSHKSSVPMIIYID